MSDRPQELKLVSLIHYHQEPKTQPRAQTIRPGYEKIELVTRGRGWVEREGEWVEVRPGALLWHREGDCTIGRSDGDNPYSCLALGVSCHVDGLRRVPRFSSWLDLEAINQLAEQSIALFVDEFFPNEALLDYVYGRLLFQALLFHRRREEQSVSDPLRRALEAIDQRFHERLQTKDLARASGWSEAHLHDQFRRCLGTTPRQALLARRIRYARELLVGSGLSIKQIAARAGFTHSSAFCASFKRSVGVTPRRYRDAYFYGGGLGGG